MDSIININNRYNEHKDILVDLFVDYYGREYRDLIRSRIDNTPVDLSSTPEDDYHYLTHHPNNISEEEKSLIESQYNNFDKVMNESRNINYDLLIDYVVDIFKITDRELIRKNRGKFLSLFTDKTFTRGLIDGFSKKSLDLLNDEYVSTSAKMKILKKQEDFNDILKLLGLELDSVNDATINKVIEYRKKLKESYRCSIAFESEYGKNINSLIKDIIGFDVEPKFLNPICLARRASAITIDVNTGSDIVYYRYVKIPLIYFINMNVKGLDFDIIHELIHIIESYMNYVGISVSGPIKKNNIMNEIRTQKLAIKLTKILHERGIFLYDDPMDYKIEGYSFYENMFPLTDSFLDKYESVFSDCAINNDIKGLEKLFGESWNLYSEYVSDVFARIVYYYENCKMIPVVQMDESASNLIKSMESNYERMKTYFRC